MGKIVGFAYLKAALARNDARHFLFFPRTDEGKSAADDYFARLAERTVDRDTRISMQARVAQLKAIVGGGKAAPDDLARITQPVFVANGDNDLMVASDHSADLARRIPNSKLTIYPRSGHGGDIPIPPGFRPGSSRLPCRRRQYSRPDTILQALQEISHESTHIHRIQTTSAGNDGAGTRCRRS